MTILDGKALSIKIKEDLKVKVKQLKDNYNKQTSLAVVMVGNNPASAVYVRNKIKSCEEIGVNSLSYHLEENATSIEVEQLLKSLACNDDIDGILVQLPLPKHLDEDKILALIPDDKDVDGFSPNNVGKLTLFKDGFKSCTPYGVIKLLEEYNIDLNGKHAVIIGRSNIVGKPMAMLLLEKNATVSICHSKTKDLKSITSQADILIVAIGRAKFVNGDMVKEGAVVVDVGMNKDENGKLCGDVDFESVSGKASFITKVPGGVGPMTITMLLSNTYKSSLGKVNGK